MMYVLELVLILQKIDCQLVENIGMKIVKTMTGSFSNFQKLKHFNDWFPGKKWCNIGEKLF